MALTAGPWIHLLICAAMCMGPPFVRLLLLAPGIGGALAQPPPDSSSPPPSSPSGPPAAAVPET